MIATFLAQNATWLLLIGALLLGISIWNAAHAANQSRRAAYYALREEALRKTRRWMLIATTVTLVGIASIFVAANRTDLVNVTLNAPTPSPAPIISPSKIPVSVVPTATPTRGPTATPRLSPSSTAVAILASPSNPVPSLLLTPLPGAVAPLPGAKFTLTTLASILDSSKNPVDPGQVFPAGTKTIQILFKAGGVNNNAEYSLFCFREGKVADSIIDLWRWNTQPQNSRVFCSIDGSVGTYKVEAYLGFIKQFEVTFTVIAPTPTPTTTH